MISVFLLIKGIADHQLSKTPREVLDFAYYHFLKGKNEEEVREELAKMGWSNKSDQEDVFNSIATIFEMQDISRNA